DWLPEFLTDELRPVRSSNQPQYIDVVEDIFLQNKDQLLFDFNQLSLLRESRPISPSNQVFGEWIFVEEGAEIEGATLNSLQGPIYIGKDAQIEEGSFLKGFVAVG